MIGQNESHYRQYRIPGGKFPGGYEVAKIHIYERNKIVFTTNRGYFEDNKDGTGMNVLAIDIPDPVRANKVNLERSDCFFVLQSKSDRFVELYIPAQIGAVTIGPEEEMDHYSETHQTGFFHPVLIALHGIVHEYTGEKDARGDYVRQETHIKVIHERTSPRWELDEDGREAEKLRKEMNALGIGVGLDDAINLLYYYDVKLKP